MSKIKILNSSLLIVGTSIGAGMLGLPVETGQGGFFPSVFYLVITWIVMTGTALLLADLLAQYKENVNFLTLSEKILGRHFKNFTFIVYILLFLFLTLAYVKGGGIFISDLFNITPLLLSCLIFLILLVPLIIFGSNILAFANSFLVFFMAISFFLLIFSGIKKIDLFYLSEINWLRATFSYPIFITSFGFHNILPSLNSYLKCEKSLKASIIIGTSITFSIYLIWQLFVMGTVPAYGKESLTTALECDQTAISPLKYYLQTNLLNICAQGFYFTALTTSFLGVGLGLIDFLLDSLKIASRLTYRFFLALLIYVPAVWIAQANIRIFYLSIKYGGGAACFYLLIFLPILLFYRKRASLSLERRS